MTFEEIYKMAMENQLNIETMYDYFNENPKELKRNNRFVDIYRMLLCFKENNRTDLMNALLELLKNNRIFYNIFVFMFDNRFRTMEIYDKILSKHYVLSVEGFNVLLGALNEYSGEREFYEDIYSEYYQQVRNSEDDDFLNNVEFQFMNSYHMDELFRDFPAYFTEKLKGYLEANPKSEVYFERYSKELYETFKDYDKQIYCGRLTLNDIHYLDTILREKCNYERGFRFKIEAYKILWDYYQESKDSNISVRAIHFLKEQLYECLTVDYEKDKPEELVIPPNAIRYLADMIKKADECKARTKFIINCKEANEYYNDLVQLEKKERIWIDFGGIGNDGRLSLKDYIRSHLFYDSTVELVKRFDFSPFEQYIYAYYLTTILKKYRYYKDDKQIDSEHTNMSRDLYYIIYGNYIVCAGYVNYFVNLLTKLDFDSAFLLVTPPETQDIHARVMTHIVDPKYGIDGVYIGDPTHDSGNDMSFAWAFMTKDKKSYKKYQEGTDSAFDFYSALKDLKLSDAQCDARNKEFYDTINSPISNDVKIKAIRRVFETIHPDFTEEEIDYYMQNIADRSNLLYLTDKMLKKKCTEAGNIRTITEDIDSDVVKLKWCGSSTDNKDFFEVSFIIEIDELEQSDIMSKLMLYLDKDVIVEYSDYYKAPMIKFKMGIDATLEDLLLRMKRYVKTLENNLNTGGNKVKNADVEIIHFDSLFELFLMNNKIARAILNTSNCTREQNVFKLFVSGLISLDEIAALMKFNAIDRNVFIGICESANISLNKSVFAQEKSPSK